MSCRKREKALRDLLAETSKRDVSRITLEDDLVKELGLDSLSGLALLAAIEKHFDVRFPDERLGEFRTMGQLLGVIEGKSEDRRP